MSRRRPCIGSPAAMGCGRRSGPACSRVARPVPVDSELAKPVDTELERDESLRHDLLVFALGFTPPRYGNFVHDAADKQKCCYWGIFGEYPRQDSNLRPTA